jgi:diketogulonate reductase-like aldo/keto reductase
MTSLPTLTLNDGVEMPQLGFGVYHKRRRALVRSGVAR